MRYDEETLAELKNMLAAELLGSVTTEQLLEIPAVRKHIADLWDASEFILNSDEVRDAVLDRYDDQLHDDAHQIIDEMTHPAAAVRY